VTASHALRPTRDRSATERRIVEAVGRVLARDGFQGLGIRAVAREAAVDKQLLSRYFGTLDRLIAAYASGSDFWWCVDELIGDHLPAPEQETWAGWAPLIMERHVAALRARPITQQILIWELVEANPLSDVLAVVREERSADLLRRVALRVGRPPDASVRALVALFGAGATYLVLRARTYSHYVGFDLREAASWAEFMQTISAAMPPPPQASMRSRSRDPR
jgi:AcrR family transcriptional regulator